MSRAAAAGHSAADPWAGGLVVSTECPTCGAPLDFSEGTTALRCGHCGSRLLVTGRGQVLSYRIPARVTPARALATARRAAAGGDPPAAPHLWLVPYYRLTAAELCWTRQEPPPRPLPEAAARLASLGADLAEVTSVLARGRRGAGAIALAARHIERNFLAADLHGIVPYSLGIRPSVLRLELFRPRELAATDRVLAPALGAGAALDRDLQRAGDDTVLHREIVGRTLALVYFPFWVVAREGRHAGAIVVDGASGEIVGSGVLPAPGVPAPAPESSDVPAAPPARTLGFRALACPNCGWDLPADDVADVIFPCTACHRAWRLAADRLEEAPHTVAAGGRRVRGAPAEHLPLWLVDAETPGRRLVVPGFRCRGLRLLVDLAARLSEADLAIEADESGGSRLRGVHVDRDDALALARLVAARPPRRGAAATAPPPAPRADAEPRLLWLPFDVGPYAIREPRSGASLPRRLLPWEAAPALA